MTCWGLSLLYKCLYFYLQFRQCGLVPRRAVTRSRKEKQLQVDGAIWCRGANQVSLDVAS